MNDTKKTTVYRCPWCGNGKPNLIEDNGLKVTDPELTLLCVARVKPEDSSQSYDDNGFGRVLNPDPDGLVQCGYQWNPNDEG
jgi:hypothetical protein